MISQIADILGTDGNFARLCEGYEYRPQQIEMAKRVGQALIAKANLLAEAGTGVGKTVGYLVPAVLFASGSERVVVSTHTINLQQQLLNKDIPLLQQVMPDHPFTAVLMKGRSNYLCLQELDNASSLIVYQNDPTFDALKRWARQTQTGDVQELDFAFSDWHEVCANTDTCRRKECPYHAEDCFYYKMCRRAAVADIIVVNHSLFFADLGIRQMDANSAVLPNYGPVIFDEAHHLEDVATRAFGVEFSNYRVPFIINRLRKRSEIAVSRGEYNMLLKASDDLFEAFRAFNRQEFFFSDAINSGKISGVQAMAQDLIHGIESLGAQLKDQAVECEKDLKDRIEGYRKMLLRASDELRMLFFIEDDTYFKWCEKTGGKIANCTLHMTPTRVTNLLDEMLWEREQATVLTSATLSNSGAFHYIGNRLGLSGAREVMVGSPFNYPKQALLYVPSDLDIPGNSEEYTAQLAERIRQLIEISRGRAFLLFTSYRMLNSVFDILVQNTSYMLLKQGDMSNDRLMQRFRKYEDACLMGVHSFWEGVDVKGDKLSLVLIDKLPFAVPDTPTNRARCDDIEAQGGNWFTEYAVPQAQIRLKQGFGRLIRTNKDRGVVAILDSRIHKKFYGKEFLKYLPSCPVTTDIGRVVDFYAEEPRQ